MEAESRWMLTDDEKASFIATLTPNLTMLRAKAEISQEELANLIGISRQTYSALERKVRRMSWSTYLSLVFFYDNNQKTHQMIRQLSIFPKELIIQFNDGTIHSNPKLSCPIGTDAKAIVEYHDEQDVVPSVH